MRGLVPVVVVLACVAGALGYLAPAATGGAHPRRSEFGRLVQFGPPTAALTRGHGKTTPGFRVRGHAPRLRSSGLAPALLYRRYVAVLPGGRRVHFTWNYVRLSRTCAVPVAPTFPVHMEPLPVGSGCRRFGFPGGARTGSTGSVRVPRLQSMPIGRALKTIHAAGLRTSFGAIDSPCGDALPYIWKQKTAAGKRVPARSVVRLALQADPYPSVGVPIHHKKWTYVENLVGHEFGYVKHHSDAVAVCVHLNATRSSDATRLVVVFQHPAAGTRVPAYGIRLPSGGFHQTTVAITLGTP